jgi:hypothetical protein
VTNAEVGAAGSEESAQERQAVLNPRLHCHLPSSDVVAVCELSRLPGLSDMIWADATTTRMRRAHHTNSHCCPVHDQAREYSPRIAALFDRVDDLAGASRAAMGGYGATSGAESCWPSAARRECATSPFHDRNGDVVMVIIRRISEQWGSTRGPYVLMRNCGALRTAVYQTNGA